MAWKRESDTAAFDPRVLGVAEHPAADYRSVNEVWGFFSRATSLLAQHPNDSGELSWAQCLPLAGHDRDYLELLWQQCQFAGLGQVVVRDGRRVFKALADPDFVHVKTASETAWESDRKRDNSNPRVTMPVRARDGDACRYCGLVVWFGQKQGDKRGTYDHRLPRTRATDPQHLVVACGACNSGRGAVSRDVMGSGGSPEQAMAAADARYPLLPVPAEAYYTPVTRLLLGRNREHLAAAGMSPPPPAPPDEAPLQMGSPQPSATPAPAGTPQPTPTPPPAAPRSATPPRAPTTPTPPHQATPSGATPDRAPQHPDRPPRAGRAGPPPPRATPTVQDGAPQPPGPPTQAAQDSATPAGRPTTPPPDQAASSATPAGTPQLSDRPARATRPAAPQQPEPIRERCRSAARGRDRAETMPTDSDLPDGTGRAGPGQAEPGRSARRRRGRRAGRKT